MADVREVVGFPERFKVEVHGAATDQAVAGGDILVEVVVLELGATLVTQDFAGGKPDIALNASAAQGADGSAVFAHEEHGAGLLGG